MIHCTLDFVDMEVLDKKDLVCHGGGLCDGHYMRCLV
jgi:hypothetical protein